MKQKQCDEISKFLRESNMDDDEYAEVMKMLKDAVDEPEAAAADMALDGYRSPAVRSVARYNAALRKVAHVLPTVPLACDSAEAVFAAALRKLGVDLSGMAPSSYEFVFDSAGPFAARREPGANLSPRERQTIEAQSPGLSRFLGAA